MNTDNAGAALGPDLAAEAPAPSNGQAPAAEAAPEASPCADCEDGVTIPALGRSSELALGFVGALIGGVILLMGIDLITGGAVSRAVGLGRGGDSADASS